MILFGILCAIDAPIALVVLFIFFWGLSDGTVSSYNIGLWLGLLGGVAALFGAGVAVRASGQRALANTLRRRPWPPPAFSYFLFFLMLIVTNPRWK